MIILYKPFTNFYRVAALLIYTLSLTGGELSTIRTHDELMRVLSGHTAFNARVKTSNDRLRPRELRI